MLVINCQPDILLLDEPDSALSPFLKEWLYEQLSQMAESGAMTILVSHNHKVLKLFDPEYIIYLQGNSFKKKNRK